MNWIKGGALLALALSVSACMAVPNVRGTPVPTAAFVFFNKGSAEPTADSAAVLNEAAAYLTQYDNTSVRVVGHVSADEGKTGLDKQRANSVAQELVQRGAQSARMRLVGVGTKESIAGATAGRDPALDRRVELLFNAM